MHMFNRVAQAVEAKFTIEKVHCCGFWPSDIDTEVLRLIAGQVEKEGLSKLEIDIAFRRFTEKGDVLISLVEASKKWTIQTLRIYFFSISLYFPHKKLLSTDFRAAASLG